MIYQSTSPQETQRIGQKIAEDIKGGGIITLTGPLGAGKTTLIQGIAQGLGIKERIISPTFILMRQYPLPSTKSGKFYHLDLYRLEGKENIQGLGLEEIFANPNNIVLIEWAEKLGTLKPQSATQINITILGKTKRQIEVI